MPGSVAIVVGSIAMALNRLYGLQSPPVSLIGRICTTESPCRAVQEISSLSASVSPTPRSFSPRTAKTGARTPAILFSGLSSSTCASYRADCVVTIANWRGRREAHRRPFVKEYAEDNSPLDYSANFSVTISKGFRSSRTAPLLIGSASSSASSKLVSHAFRTGRVVVSFSGQRPPSDS